MWPFGSEENSDKLKDELPEGLQSFFESSAPSGKKAEVDNPKEAQVLKVLASRKELYNHEFERYKREESLRKVASINCAELQKAVLECYLGWLFLTGSQCTEEISRTTKCMDVQLRALKQLRYDDCYDKKHCSQIRAAVDLFFTTNFGQFGENMNEKTVAEFDRDVDNAFSVFWG